LATRGESLGAAAVPASNACVASARRAADRETAFGLAPGSSLSKFCCRVNPVAPPEALESATLDGCDMGCPEANDGAACEDSASDDSASAASLAPATATCRDLVVGAAEETDGSLAAGPATSIGAAPGLAWLRSISSGAALAAIDDASAGDGLARSIESTRVSAN
jgi:hypothetical protein